MQQPPNGEPRAAAQHAPFAMLSHPGTAVRGYRTTPHCLPQSPTKRYNYRYNPIIYYGQKQQYLNKLQIVGDGEGDDGIRALEARHSRPRSPAG